MPVTLPELALRICRRLDSRYHTLLRATLTLCDQGPALVFVCETGEGCGIPYGDIQNVVSTVLQRSNVAYKANGRLAGGKYQNVCYVPVALEEIDVSAGVQWENPHHRMHRQLRLSADCDVILFDRAIQHLCWLTHTTLFHASENVLLFHSNTVANFHSNALPHFKLGAVTPFRPGGDFEHTGGANQFCRAIAVQCADSSGKEWQYGCSSLVDLTNDALSRIPDTGIAEILAHTFTTEEHVRLVQLLNNQDNDPVNQSLRNKIFPENL